MLDISIKGVSRLVKVEENPLRRWNLTFMNLDETSVVTHRNKVGRCWYNIDSSLFQFNHDFNVTYFESNSQGCFIFIVKFSSESQTFFFNSSSTLF